MLRPSSARLHPGLTSPALQARGGMGRPLLLTLLSVAVAAACGRAPEGGGEPVAAPTSTASAGDAAEADAPAASSAAPPDEVPAVAGPEPSAEPPGSAAPPGSSAAPPLTVPGNPGAFGISLTEVVTEPAGKEEEAKRELKKGLSRLLRRCFEQSLENRPGVGGKLTVRFSIGGDGKAKASASGTAPRAVVDCAIPDFERYPEVTWPQGLTRVTATWELRPGELPRRPPARH